MANSNSNTSTTRSVGSNNSNSNLSNRNMSLDELLKKYNRSHERKVSVNPYRGLDKRELMKKAHDLFTKNQRTNLEKELNRMMVNNHHDKKVHWKNSRVKRFDKENAPDEIRRNPRNVQIERIKGGKRVFLFENMRISATKPKRAAENVYEKTKLNKISLKDLNGNYYNYKVKRDRDGNLRIRSV